MTSKALKYGGFLAGAVLIIFGAIAITMGFNGRSTVHDSLKLEAITGSDDMTPAAIATEGQGGRLAGDALAAHVHVAGQAIDTGSSARCFASYIRIHALEASGGKTYGSSALRERQRRLAAARACKPGSGPPR